MDVHIIDALRTSKDGLTTRAITQLLTVHYPGDKDLKKTINGLLYGVLSKSKRVLMTTPSPDGKSKAPVWSLISKTIPFVDLATASPDIVNQYRGDPSSRWFGPLDTPDAPQGSVLAGNYQLQLAMAVEKERCLGNQVQLFSSNADLTSLVA